MRVIRQLLIAWVLLALLMRQGFGQPPKPLWSDFTYNSSEEKDYWDKLPEKKDKLNGWIFIFKIKLSRQDVSNQWVGIDHNFSEGFNGYIKSRTFFACSFPFRTIYHFVDGYLVREKSWYINGQDFNDRKYKTVSSTTFRDGLQTTWYENGQTKLNYNYEDGKLDGLQTTWYENGQISFRGTWINGKLDGIGAEWYENGQTRLNYNYEDGKLDGLQTTWYENGQTKLNYNYEDGKLDGPQTTWYESGQSKLNYNYEDGKLNGLQTTWYENGQKESVVSFKDGYEDGRPFYRWDENGLQEYSPFGRTLTIPTISSRDLIENANLALFEWINRIDTYVFSH